MQYYATISAFTMMGAVHLAATVRSDSPEGAIAPILSIAIDVPDEGTDAPDEFLASCLSWLLEDLSNRAPHCL